MRQLPVIAAAIAFVATSAMAESNAQRTAPPPIYIKHTEVNTFVTKGDGRQSVLNLGYNVLGNQHAIACPHDEGCLITVASIVGISAVSGSWSICSLVDGVPAQPDCQRQNAAVGQEGGVGNGLASFLLSKGRHVIETDVLLRDNGGALLGSWEAHYTLFIDPPHGGN
jgi:hypothetical protein